MSKPLHFSGSFYPSDEKELHSYVDHFNAVIKEHLPPNWQERYTKPKRAIIVPHAGYVFSGFTANMAYSLAQSADSKRVIVIGPSHKIAFAGVSCLQGYENYSTPFGDIPIDRQYIATLGQKFALGFDERIHAEHSTETQMPFIKHYLNKPILELIYSQMGYEELSVMLQYLLQDKDNFVIISTDLSHFHTKEKAFTHDSVCLQAVDKLDLELYNTGCEACGGVGVQAMILAAQKLGLESHILDYRTSADYSKDESRVVGYASALFSEL